MAARGSKWNEVKRAWLNREGSFKTLGERFGLTVNSIKKQSLKGKWTSESKLIAQEIHDKAVADMVPAQKRHVQEILAEADKLRAQLSRIKWKAEDIKIKNAADLRQLVLTFAQLDNITRQALGLDIEATPDEPLSPGTAAFQAALLQELIAITKIVNDGGMKDRELDFEKLKKVTLIEG